MRITTEAKQISDEDYKWIAERAETLPSGVVTFPAHVVKKYRKLTGQEHESGGLIKLQMVNEFGRFA